MTEPTFNQDYELIVAPSYDPRYTPAVTPTAGVFDSPTYMLCINAQWWTHILGTINRLAYTDAWKDDDYQKKLDAVDNVLVIMDEIAKSIECGNMATFELRQNPNNLCQLQQSLDGGSSWTTVFDYSQCGVGGGGTTNINIQIGIDHIEVLNNEWNIDVDIVYNNIKANDEDTNAIYCLGLKIFYYGLLSGIIERVKNGNNQNLITQAIAVGVATVTSFVVGTPLTGSLVAIGSIASLIAQSIINTYNENQLVSALNSENIFTEITCCAYEKIKDTKVGFVDFQNMFTGCLDLSDEAMEIIPLFQEAVSSFDVFLTWLSAINTAYDASVSNALPNLCVSCGVQECWDFQTLDDVNIVLGGWDMSFGNPSPSINNASNVNSGVYPLNQSGTTDGIATALEIDLGDPRVVTEVKYNYWMQQNTDQKVAIGLRLLDDQGVQLYEDIEIRDLNADATWRTWTFSMSEASVKTVVVFIFRTSDPTVTGTAFIDNVCVK